MCDSQLGTMGINGGNAGAAWGQAEVQDPGEWGLWQGVAPSNFLALGHAALRGKAFYMRSAKGEMCRGQTRLI